MLDNKIIDNIIDNIIDKTQKNKKITKNKKGK